MTPIFVFGCPRSGTTVLGTSLQRHPAIGGGTETHFFISALQAFDEVWRYSAERLPPELNWLDSMGITKDDFLAHYMSGLVSLVEHHEKGALWLDHTGGNVLVWDKLLKVFPAAKFIFTVRDGRNVVESVMHSFFGGSFSFRAAADMWVEHNEAGVAAITHAADQGMLVSYESLLKAPMTELRRIVEFLGLDWSDDVAAPYTRESPINSSFRDEELADKVAAKWLAWEDWKRAEFEEIGGHMLRWFGYEVDAGWAHRPGRGGPAEGSGGDAG